MSTTPETPGAANQVQITRTGVTVVSIYNVAGAEPVKLDYRVSHIAPTTAKVTVINGKWQYVVVAGPIVKKDGTPSLNSSDARFSRGWREDGTPTWVRLLAASCEEAARAVMEDPGVES